MLLDFLIALVENPDDVLQSRRGGRERAAPLLPSEISKMPRF